MRYVAAALLVIGAAVAATVPCTYVAHDEATGKYWSYDLTPLTRDVLGADLESPVTPSGSLYYLNVCGETTRCSGNALCERDEYYHDTGRALTATQTFSNNAEDASAGVVLKYTAEPCVEGGPAMQTTVRVGCSRVAERPYVSYVSEAGNCSREVHVWAANGCGEESVAPDDSSSPDVSCEFTIGDGTRWWRYDLSALHHFGEDAPDLEYEGAPSGSKYFMNLCGSTLRCPGNSVCERDEYLVDHPLGATHTQMALADDRSDDLSQGLRVVYTGGEQCWANGPRMTTTVLVGCSAEAGAGYIGQVVEGNCTRTYVVWSASGCGKEVLPDCKFSTYDITGVKWYYDFSALHHEDGKGSDLEFGPTTTGSRWFVNLCGSTLYCKDNAVCERDEYLNSFGYGPFRTQKFSAYKDDPSAGAVVEYSGGSKCQDGPARTVRVTLRCSHGAEPGYISAVEPGNCTANVTIWSEHACGQTTPPVPDTSSEVPPTPQSSEVPPTPESSVVPPVVESSSVVPDDDDDGGKSGFWWWWILLIVVVAVAAIGVAAFFLWKKYRPRSGYMSINDPTP